MMPAGSVIHSSFIAFLACFFFFFLISGPWSAPKKAWRAALKLGTWELSSGRFGNPDLSWICVRLYGVRLDMKHE